jgi:parallel beta-helix repeat protein
MKRNKIRKVLVYGIVMLLVALLLATISPNVSGYTIHSSIEIDGNTQFTSSNGVTGGSGTQIDPFIIEGWEINAGGSGSAIFIQNTDAYFVIRDCKVYNSGTGVYDSGIRITNVENGIIENNLCINNEHGISLTSSSNNLIMENECSSNEDGILIYHYSDYNLISKNLCSDNTLVGMRIQLYCEYNVIYDYNNCSNNNWGISLQWVSNNVISNNTLSSNNYYGVDFYGSTYNELKYNQLTNNGIVGVRLYSNSNNNIIHHNNFINNVNHVNQMDTSTLNTWDDGYPSGGNYWDDYTGSDIYNGPNQDILGLDGIGDTSYAIPGGGYDYYPLMEPWTAEADLGAEIKDLIDDVEELGLSTGIENSLVSKLENALASWEKGNANACENKLEAFINQVKALSGNQLTEEQANALIKTAQTIINNL